MSGLPVRAHPGASDCEAIGDGWLAQPVNAISSGAFLVAGAALFRSTRGSDRLFAVLVGANAVGGFGFHGPGDAVSHWLHDVALAGTLAFIVVADVRPRTSVVLATTAASGALLVLAPDASNLVSGVLVAGIAVAETRRFLRGRDRADRRRLLRRFGLPAALLGAAVVVDVLSRTDRPLCRPDSLLQGHAAWHVLTAAALWAWGSAALGARDRAVSD
jgi:hypothetical protein